MCELKEWFCLPFFQFFFSYGLWVFLCISLVLFTLLHVTSVIYIITHHFFYLHYFTSLFLFTLLHIAFFIYIITRHFFYLHYYTSLFHRYRARGNPRQSPCAFFFSQTEPRRHLSLSRAFSLSLSRSPVLSLSRSHSAENDLNKTGRDWVQDTNYNSI